MPPQDPPIFIKVEYSHQNRVIRPIENRPDLYIRPNNWQHGTYYGKHKRISMVASKSFSMLFGLKSKVIWWCCLCHYVKLKGSIPFIQICSKIIFFFLVHISDSLSWNRWPETGLLVPCQEEWVASSLSGNAIAFYLLRHKDRQTQLFNIPSIEMIESRKSVPKTTLSNECMTQRLWRNPSIPTFLLSVPVE